LFHSFFRYEELLPEAAPDQTFGENEEAFYLLDAYNLFQRLEIASEVVLNDLRSPSSTTSNAAILPRQMWLLLRREIQKVVQNVYTELLIRGLPIPLPLARTAISQEIRCLEHSAYRDVRDFVIFRSMRHAVDHYSHNFRSILL
jgi:hypothetical protein